VCSGVGIPISIDYCIYMKCVCRVDKYIPFDIYITNWDVSEDELGLTAGKGNGGCVNWNL
jgi:hypothetical protein